MGLIDFGRGGRRNASLTEGFTTAGDPAYAGLGEAIRADRTLLELLPLAAVRTEAEDAARAVFAAPRSDSTSRAALLLHRASVLRDLAARSGEAEALAAAASACRTALGLKPTPQGRRRILTEQARILMLASELFGDEAAGGAALAKLDDARRNAASLPSDPVLDALVARSTVRAALKRGTDPKAALLALDAVILALGPGAEGEASRRVRADVQIGLASAAGDRTLADRAALDLSRLSLTLDPDYRPLSWLRVEILRGQALLVIGEIAGDAATLAEAVAVLARAAAEARIDMSPIDAARAQHAYGLALAAMGEACDDGAVFDRAVHAFGAALEPLERARAMPLHALVTHDGAACLARRAERTGDLVALETAEQVFRNSLKLASAAADPLHWAVTQVALARIYEVQARLRGDKGERADAAFALAAALEVFAEHGLHALSASTLAALERVRL